MLTLIDGNNKAITSAGMRKEQQRTTSVENKVPATKPLNGLSKISIIPTNSSSKRTVSTKAEKWTAKSRYSTWDAFVSELEFE